MEETLLINILEMTQKHLKTLENYLHVKEVITQLFPYLIALFSEKS